jgi:hypothetical protein
MEPYLFRVLRRACKMTAADIGIRNWRVSFVKGLWAIIALAVMISFGWNDILIDRFGEIWAGIIAFLILIAIVFISNLLAAPAQLRAEAGREIQELTTILGTHQDHQEMLDRLWQLRSTGISIRNKRTGSKEELIEWEAGYNVWRNQTLIVAGSISPNLRQWIERLDRTEPIPGNLQPFNGHHELHARIMCNILSRLQRYLERQL